MTAVLRVGFDGRALVSPAAGVRRYARELFGALAARDDLTVIAVGASPHVELSPGMERVAAGTSLPTNAGWMLTGLPSAARRAQVDLFHAPAYTAPLGGPRPLVLTIHDVSYARHPEWYPYRRDPLRRAFYQRSARAADRIITDSRFSKDEIIAAYGLPGDRVAVVPLAASPLFTPGERLTLPPGIPPRFLLHVGDLHVRRNLPLVARALAAARARTPSLRDLSLVLSGVDRGSAGPLLEISSRAGGETPLVICTGVISESVLLALYRSAMSLVYPSRYEGFGLPLLEAMACGTPVIAARTSSIPEVTGDAATLLDPDDEEGWRAAIERVVLDDAFGASLRDAGLRRAATFSWRRTAQETADIYKSLVPSR